MKRIILILLMFILTGCQINQPQEQTQTPWVITSSPQNTPVPTPTPFIAASQDITIKNTGKIIELARIGDGIISDISYSPSEEIFAVATSIGIFLYDSNTLEQVDLLKTKSPVNSIAYSPDGKMLASAMDDATVLMWDLETKQEIRFIAGFTASAADVIFSPDGKILATTSWYKGVTLVDLENTSSYRNLKKSGDYFPEKNVIFSQDGNLVASLSTDGPISVWNVKSGKLLYTLDGEVFLFTPDGKILVPSWKGIYSYESESGEFLYQINKEMSDIDSAALSPDGKLLAMGTSDGILSIWDMDNQQMKCYINGNKNSIIDVEFSDDGISLASVSTDNSIRFWGVESCQLLHSISMSSGMIENLEISLDGKNIAAKIINPGYPLHSDNYSMELWDLQSGLMKDKKTGYDSSSFSSNGKSLFFDSKYTINKSAYGYGGDIDLQDKNDGRIFYTFNVAQPDWQLDWIVDIAISQDEKRMVVGTAEGPIQIWDIESETLLHTFEEYGNFLGNSVTFSPDGKLLASGSSSGCVCLWDIDNEKLIFSNCVGGLESPWITGILKDPKPYNAIYSLITYPGHIGNINSLNFSPDGKLLISSSADNTIILWDVERGSLLRILQGHTNSVTDAVFSPNMQFIISSSSDGTVRIWGISDD